MDIKEIYDKLGGNYEEILGRVYTEENICMLLSMLKEDNSYEQFLLAMQEGQYERAAEEIHGLKGICSNLALDSLFTNCVEILNALRAGNVQHAKQLMPQLKKLYQATLQEIEKI